jgi:predicted extracellular nuclease
MNVKKIAYRSLTVCRAGVAGAAAVVLLAACGGGDGSSTGSSATDNADTSADAGAAGSAEFCEQAGDIDQRVDGVLSELGDGSSAPEAIHAAADELRAIDAPEAITTEWTALVDGLDQIADALADLDLTDGDSVAALEDIEGRLTTASTNVENYLQEECGIN